MAVPLLGLPPGPRLRAFRALEEVLREDPGLAGVVRTWASWDGSRVDAMPLASGMFPFLGLSPHPLPNDVMGEGRTVINLGVEVQVATAGLVKDDFLNLWDLVEDALVRGRRFRDTNVFCHLQANGAFAYRVLGPPLDAFRTAGDRPDEFLAGVGRVDLRVSRPA